MEQAKGGEDEGLFSQLNVAIESINNREINENIKSNQGFNFLYFSTALSQLITKEISEELSKIPEESKLLSKTQRLVEKLNQIKELCSIDDQESDEAAFWNRYLYLKNLSYMHEYFGDKEQLKVYRNMVENLRQSLMQIATTSELKQLITSCEKFAFQVAPKAEEAMYFSQMSRGSIAPEYHSQVRIGLTQH
jgi:hypothetical protein